jgi:hypothetical protein
VRSEYYVLGQEGEPVFIHLRDEPGYGRILAHAVYTSEDGGQQREDLQRYKNTEVIPINPEDLLNAMDRGYPSSVFLDGKKLGGSVFRGTLKTELGLPIRYPRLVNLEDLDSG